MYVWMIELMLDVSFCHQCVNGSIYHKHCTDTGLARGMNICWYDNLCIFFLLVYFIMSYVLRNFVLSEQNIIKFCLDVNDPKCTLLFCLICLFKHLWSYVIIFLILYHRVSNTQRPRTREKPPFVTSPQSQVYLHSSMSNVMFLYSNFGELWAAASVSLNASVIVDIPHNSLALFLNRSLSRELCELCSS